MASSAPASSTKPARPRKKKSTVRRVLGRVVAVLASLAIILGILGVAGIAILYSRTTLPDPNKDFQTNTSFVYYRDGKSKLGSFAVQNRQTLAYRDIPDNVKEAVVAAENRTFWTDKGISVTGIGRSLWTIARGGELQGGSTITQQYIKILYLNSERSASRKITELMLAVKLSKQKSKEQILEGYLNTIYFGRGAYGIQAASRAYFNKDAKDLSDPQAAVLASVLNNPAIFDPSAAKGNKQRLFDRYRYVLAGMAQMGSISESERARWSKALPTLPDVPRNSRFGGPKGFLLAKVENELKAEGFSEEQITGGGLQITTTFDADAQDAAVKTAQKYTRQAAAARGKSSKDLHAAIASVQVGTGEVLALYGGPDYVSNSRNWATTDRPAASTFKAYAATAALENDFNLYSRLNGNTFTPPGDSVPIRNEFGMQYGPGVTLLKATAESINTAFVDLVTRMPNGPQQVVQAAEAAGVPKGAGWDLNNRIALGTAEVSPLEQAGGFATFANNGKRVANHVVKQVKSANGRVLYKAAANPKQTIDEGVARDVTYALTNVVEQGTGTTVATLGRPVAGKTGTAGVKDTIVSAWFVAYTKQVSTAVMYVAGPNGTSDLDDYARPGDRTFFGGTYPAMTWRDYMAAATKGMPVERFDPPANVNRASAPPVNTARSIPTTDTRTPQSAPPTTPKASPTQRPTQSATQRPTRSATQQPTRTATAQPTRTPTAPTQTATKVRPAPGPPSSVGGGRPTEPGSSVG